MLYRNMYFRDWIELQYWTVHNPWSLTKFVSICLKFKHICSNTGTFLLNKYFKCKYNNMASNILLHFHFWIYFIYIYSLVAILSTYILPFKELSLFECSQKHITVLSKYFTSLFIFFYAFQTKWVNVVSFTTIWSVWCLVLNKIKLPS